MRKLLAVLLAALMLLSFAAIAEEQVTITIGLPYNTEPSDAEGPDMWFDIISLYEATYPNYNVEVICQGENSDDQNAALQMAAAANNLPDLTYGSFGYVDDWSNVGLLLNLEDYLDEEFFAQFAAGAVDYTNAFNQNEGVYGLPCRAETQGWLYNTALFEQVGLEIPTTWDEFMNAVKVFRENGITPISHGATDIWAIWGYHAMFNNYGLTLEMAQQLQNREIKFADNETFVKTFTRIAELAEAGAYPEDVATTSNDVAMARFAAGEAAMYGIYDGIATQTFEGYKATGESDIVDHCVFNFGPKFEDGVEDFCGLRTYGWTLMPAASLADDPARCEAVMAFLKLFFSAEGTAIVQNYQVPATDFEMQHPEGESMLHASMFESYVADIVPVPDNNQAYFDQSIKPTYRNAITGLICGTLTVEDALSMMQDWADTM